MPYKQWFAFPHLTFFGGGVWGAVFKGFAANLKIETKQINVDKYLKTG